MFLFVLFVHIYEQSITGRIEFSISCGGETNHSELPSPRDRPRLRCQRRSHQPPATLLFFSLGNLFLFLFSRGVGTLYFCTTLVKRRALRTFYSLLLVPPAPQDGFPFAEAPAERESADYSSHPPQTLSHTLALRAGWWYWLRGIAPVSTLRCSTSPVLSWVSQSTFSSSDFRSSRHVYEIDISPQRASPG